jgi:Ca2+/Na+ antiporter
VLFRTKLIENSFNERVLLSLVFGDNFENTYFFSGATCLLMANLLELHELQRRKLFVFQLCVVVFVSWMLLSTRQNFFMDVATALVFTHYTFYFIDRRIDAIDRAVFALYDRVVGRQPDDYLHKDDLE